jgi:hypothetical protein
MLKLFFIVICLMLFIFVVALPVFGLILGITSYPANYHGTDLEGAGQIDSRH